MTVPTSIFRYGATPTAVPSLRLARSADVVVIGDDNAGLALATYLAGQGREVLVFGDGLGGDNASANSFGLMIQRPFLHDQLRRMQPERHEAIGAAYEAGFEWSTLVASGLGLSNDLRHKGSEATVDPFKVNQFLLSQALAAGVVVHQNTRVVRLSREPRGGFALRTSRGRLRTAEVAVSQADALFSLVPGMKGSIVADRRRLIASERSGDGLSGDDLAITQVGDSLVRRLQSGTAIAVLPGEKKRAAAAQDAVSPLVGPITHEWETLQAATDDGLARLGERDGIWFAVPGAFDALAMEGYLGAALGAWMVGGEAPIFADLAMPKRKGMLPFLAG